MKIEPLTYPMFDLSGSNQLLPTQANMTLLFDKINELVVHVNGPINDMNDPETIRAAQRLDRFREPEGGW